MDTVLGCMKFVVVFASVVANGSSSWPDPVRDTQKGPVRGKSQKVLDKVVETYYGIPFAKPPTGELRFRPPVPNDPWAHPINATQLPNSCMQVEDTFFGNFSGSTMWNANTNVSEDCLYLNVVVPKTPVKPKAVIVWIFGGGFYSGSATLDIYDLKILAAANNIIAVSMQYRVGALGFLYLSHPEAPGNAGMLDQLAALEWVQTNIKYFDGDPDKVTLFGESAGAVSVSLHLLSPLSRNTFRSAIMNSGSALASWGTEKHEGAILRANKVAKNLGCQKTDVREMIHCLRQKPAKDIVKEEWISSGICQFPHVPVVDGHFLVETPEMSLKRGNFKRCPIIVGNNLNEASFFMVYELKDFFNLKTDSAITRKNYTLIMDKFFDFYPQWPRENNRFGLEAIQFQYIDWRNPLDTISLRNSVEAAVGDACFVCNVMEFSKYYADAGVEVYYYYYTHMYSQNPWPKWMGVIHGYELVMMFGEPLRKHSKYTREEKQFSRRIMKYITNFAKSGDPNVEPGKRSRNEWPLYTTLRGEYLELNPKYLHNRDKSAAIGRHLKARECAFWNNYLERLVIGTDFPLPTPDVYNPLRNGVDNKTCAWRSGDGALAPSRALVVLQLLAWSLCFRILTQA